MSKLALVVEDQAEIRELIRVTLEMGGFEVSEAPDGQAAMSMTERTMFDLVLLDVMMPGPLNGLGVCERIKKDRRHRRTKVVMLSARGQSADVEAGRVAGADRYLTKPFSPRELLSVVSGVM